MTTYVWLEQRERAVRLFNGDTPGADLEHTIVNHFTEHPARVATMIDAIGRRVATGSIRSGWAILARELDTKPETATATDTSDRIRAIQQARAWISNAGGYIDRQTDLEQALFEDGYSDRGQSLRPWADDQALRAAMVAHWLEQRPRFQAAELESERRQLEHAQLLARLRAASAAALTPEQADEHAERIAAAIERPPVDLAYVDTIAPEPEDTQP
jgi:hypothetical protein